MLPARYQHEHDPADDDPHAFIREVDGRLNFEAHLVLVVDDEPSFRRLICREIRHAAPHILTVEAGHGEQALAKLEDMRNTFKVEPLFIVLDLKMPVMDGWELIGALRKAYEAEGLTQGIPIIVLSSTSGEKRSGLRKRTVHGGATRYVPLVSVAKANCVNPDRYDAVGAQGLMAWVKHFLQAA